MVCRNVWVYVESMLLIIDHSLTYKAPPKLSLCFIPVTLKVGRPELYMDNLLIPNVSEYKYLGIIICQKNGSGH